MTEENKTPPPPNPFDSFTPQAQEELKILNNIAVFLGKLDNLKATEAFLYVEARQYINTRSQLIGQAEMARLKAEAMRTILKSVPPTPPTTE